MSIAIEVLVGRASRTELIEHLLCCDEGFVPPLSKRVEIADYVEKMASNALRFEAWADRVLVGLVAMYCNDKETRVAYITSVSVLREWYGLGIASTLLEKGIDCARQRKMREIRLDVGLNNIPAIRLYQKLGFVADERKAQFLGMKMDLSERAT